MKYKSSKKQLHGSMRLVMALCACVCVLVSCENVVYTNCKELPDVWSKDSVLEFPFVIDDVHGVYQSSIILRNTDEYPNQNIWFFIDEVMPNGAVKKDTVQFFLADDFGRWTGSGAGSIFENVLIYEPRLRFKESGTYKIRIKQGMRYDDLRGISDIGLKIVRMD